jgi:hypothetical protein
MKLFTLLMICLSLSLTACSKDNGKDSKKPCEAPHCQNDNGNDDNGNTGDTGGDKNGTNDTGNDDNGGNNNDDTADNKENLLQQISAIDPYSNPIALTDKDTLISDTHLLFGEKHDEPVDIAEGEKVNDVLNRLTGK